MMNNGKSTMISTTTTKKLDQSKQNRRNKRNATTTPFTIALEKQLQHQHKYNKNLNSKSIIGHSLFSSHGILRVLNRCVRCLLIVFCWYYFILVSFDGGTLLYCKEYRSRNKGLRVCPNSNLVAENNSPVFVLDSSATIDHKKGRKWWNFRRKRPKTNKNRSLPSQQKEEQQSTKDDENENWKENMCHNAVELVGQMRYKIRFLRYFSNKLARINHNVAESATIVSSCPQPQEKSTAPRSSLSDKKRKKKKGVVKRFIRSLVARGRDKKAKKEKKKKRGLSNIDTNTNTGNDYGSISITMKQEELIRKLSLQVPQYIKEQSNQTHSPTQPINFETRIGKVHWGGSITSSNRKEVNHGEWWSTSTPISGYSILYSYLKIMDWPDDLITKYPFKPCKSSPTHCPASFAIYHTIQFRESYKPWLVTPSMKTENAAGYIYHHGYHAIDKSTLVWYTPGLHKPIQNEAYIRCIVHTFESAIYSGLQTQPFNQGGKYHVVLDCTNFSLSLVPNFHQIKRLVVIFQDHFPDRLGKIIVVNANTPTTLFYNLLWPLLTDAVRKKFLILKSDSKRYDTLKELMGGEEFIPTTLGGRDDFKFDLERYYDVNGVHGTDDMALEYLTSMPYHA